MPTIHELSQAGSINDGDEIAIFSAQNSGTRKTTAAALASYTKQAITGTPDTTVYSVTNNTVTIAAPASGRVWAQIALSTPAPSFTVILPSLAAIANGQEVLVTITQAVTALTVNGNGASTAGAPTSLAANGFFRMKFDSLSSTWYRIG